MDSQMKPPEKKPDYKLATITQREMTLAILAGCQTASMIVDGIHSVVTINPIKVTEDQNQVHIIEMINGVERVVIFPKV